MVSQSTIRGFLALILLMLIGCRPGSGFVAKIADDEKERIAKNYYEWLSNGKLSLVEQDLVDQIRNPNTLKALEQMRKLIPPGNPIREEIVGYHWSKRLNQPSEYDISYQYEYETGWCLWNIKFSETLEGNYSISQFYVTPRATSLEADHQFSITEKGPLHWVFLMATITIFSFILWTLISCIRTPLKRRKWLWIIFILLGFVQFSLNWSTGELQYNLLYIQLFGSGFLSQGVYAPWIISTSIPLGSILYWIRRASIRRESVIPELPESSPDSNTGP